MSHHRLLSRSRSRSRSRSIAIAAAALATVAASVGPIGSGVGAARAESYIPITGTGATWPASALDQWRKEVAANYGMTVNYSGTGASAGRRDFVTQSVDFAVSELPFQTAPQDGSAPEVPTTGYAYVPVTAGATSLAYHLTGTDGAPITNLRLSPATTAGIFTGSITSWNDPTIVAENPATRLPATPITPVVRADSSGSSWQFTSWLRHAEPELWNTTCGRPDCPATASFPASGGMKAQNGSLGVAGFVSQGYGEGSITYVEHSSAVSYGLPVAKLLNASGYYVAPTADAVSIALLGATAETDPAPGGSGQLDLEGVYENRDPRAYPLSSAAYLIVPTEETAVFRDEKGRTLGDFAHYSVCAGQQLVTRLGYAPLPMNLVQQSFAQIEAIPGSPAASLDDCLNPTFVAGDTPLSSQLTRTAPMPAESDRAEWTLPTTERVSGADRYAAAVNVSRAAYPATAPVVYIATGATYPDALSAGPVAAHEGGPLLLTPGDALPAAVAAEIRRLQPGRIVVVGGANSVSESVLHSLRTLGGTPAAVERIGGADRYEVSRNLARSAFGASGASVAYVATGATFPDALSAGAAAAANGGPVVLVPGSAGAPDVATTELLGSLAVEKIVIAGGPASVSVGIQSALGALAPTTREGGADRFEASANINRNAFPVAGRAVVATGLNFPDALAGSAWAGSLGVPLYVVARDCVPLAVLDAMRSQGVERVTLIGGPNSLTERVAGLDRC